MYRHIAQPDLHDMTIIVFALLAPWGLEYAGGQKRRYAIE